MDGQIFRILKKICLLLFMGDIFAHALIGASAVNGILKGSVSMLVMLILIIVLLHTGKKREIQKFCKKNEISDDL